MTVDLHRVAIAVLGGDHRQIQVLEQLVREGARLRTVGLRLPTSLGAVEMLSDPLAAARGARVLLAPIGGTDADGRIQTRLDGGPPIRLDAPLFAGMARGGLLFSGSVSHAVQAAATAEGVRVVNYAEDDEVAILNSIPTAEGAVQLAMERLPVTLHGSSAVVVGFGRCGATLGRVLHGLGARVTVAARDGASRARAAEMGLSSCSLAGLPADAARVIFNTVPALVVTREVLARTRSDVLVVDLASRPGGVDFAAAESLGREAILALGLPGKVAPVTAGRILAAVLPRMISEELRRAVR